MEQNKAKFVLTGFSHDLAFRVFEFNCLDQGRAPTRYTVRADLTLVRKYGVHIQELPLLCRRLLDASETLGPSLILPEADMIACAEKETLRNRAKARKPWQRSSSEPGVDEGSHNTEKPR